MTTLEALTGEVIRPDHPEYEQARRIHNGMIDKRPAVIVRCHNARDVAAAIGYARAEGLEIAVRGGGHNVAGRAVCEGGLVVDLSQMKGADVDPEARTLRAEPGLRWGELNEATQAAVTAGDGAASPPRGARSRRGRSGNRGP